MSCHWKGKSSDSFYFGDPSGDGIEVDDLISHITNNSKGNNLFTTTMKKFLSFGLLVQVNDVAGKIQLCFLPKNHSNAFGEVASFLGDSTGSKFVVKVCLLPTQQISILWKGNWKVVNSLNEEPSGGTVHYGNVPVPFSAIILVKVLLILHCIQISSKVLTKALSKQWLWKFSLSVQHQWFTSKLFYPQSDSA